MKLSDFARHQNITYRSAWQRFRKGKIKGAYKDEFGFVHVPSRAESLQSVAVIYARVSSSENRKNLDSQAERLTAYATARGYTIIAVVKEVGSGVNDSRQKLQKLLRQDDWGVLVVEHKDRLTRFGFRYLQTLLETAEKRIDVVNQAEDNLSDLMEDLVAVIYSFSARMYGLRRSKRRTQQIVQCLQEHTLKADSHA